MKNVCFGAKRNQYGKITVPYEGVVSALRFVHQSGGVKCNPRFPETNYGCAGRRYHNKEKIGVYVTDDKNDVIFPQNPVNEKYGFYSKPLYNAESPELVFMADQPLYVKKGVEMRVWYGEDLVNVSEYDNMGKSCSDVYARFNYVSE